MIYKEPSLISGCWSLWGPCVSQAAALKASATRSRASSICAFAAETMPTAPAVGSAVVWQCISGSSRESSESDV